LHPTPTARRISEHVYWVGAIDWDVRDFHGYSTERGSTYNAYLVVGDRITLVDTVKRPFLDQLLARISSVVDPSRIDYVISNHAEMDHSGCLPEIVEIVKPEKVYASAMGVKNLTDHFSPSLPLTVVKDGEKLGLGNLTFEIAETKMLHWPDSMFSTLLEDGILFSSDAFGMHLASEERFVDEVEGWEYQAAKYYANILMPLSGMVGKVLARLSPLLPGVRMIAPDHGPIWRSDLRKITSLYAGWSARKPTRKAVVAFDTMWGSTAGMAASIAEGLSEGGADVRLMPLQRRHRSDVVTELLDAGALLVGSPTLNNNLLPTLADLLTYLRGLKPKGLIGMAFGSYGWSGESVGQVRDYLSAMGVEMVREDLRLKFVPREADLAQCRQQGLSLAEQLLAV
jgi:flavorubredoxin